MGNARWGNGEMGLKNDWEEGPLGSLHRPPRPHSSLNAHTFAGCTFVGCLSSLGGGTLNAILFGYAKNGVPFATDPRNLIVALVSCAGTFFLWPYVCRTLAEERLRVIHETAKAKSWLHAAGEAIGLGRRPEDGISKSEFVAACEEEDFYNKCRKALKSTARAKGVNTPNPTPEQLFSLIDIDNNGCFPRP